MQLGSKVKVIREFLEIPRGSIGEVTMLRAQAIGIKFECKDAPVEAPYPCDYYQEHHEEDSNGK